MRAWVAKKTWKALVLALAIAVGALVHDAARAQQAEEKKEKKEEGLPLKPARKIEFTTDEGTWISLDVSPDGKQIVFDLLGDLYTVPIAGGEAKRLTSGIAWDCQPRFSPDGKQIAFISDRGGSDNLWLMDADGAPEASGPRAVTRETDWQIGSPAWTPDGSYLVARKWGPYPGPSDYLRAISIWLYHKDGGKGVELVKARGNTQISSGAVFSPDGKTLYFSSHAERFRYDDPPNRFQVFTFDRDTGEIQQITSGYGGGLRPIVSPDGRWLVYAIRHDAQTGLRLRDLRTRDEQWLAYPMQRDDQEGFTANDVLPGYAFAPDSKAVVFTADGKIKRVDLSSKQVTTIPFTAKVELELGPRVYTPYRIEDGPLNVRQMRWTNATPDWKRLVFSAVGKIWVMDVADGKPRRLTQSDLREYEPVISPDGKWVAYITWSDSEGGHLWKVPADGGAPVRLSEIPAYYSMPRWSPDGEKILFVMGSARGWLSSDAADVQQIRWMPAAGGASHVVLTLPGGLQSPAWSGDGTRVFYMEAAPPPPTPPADGPPRPARVLRSVRLDGVDKKTHLRFEGSFVVAIPSPDEQWVAVQERYDAYLVAFPKAGPEVVSIDLKSPAVPVKRVTLDGANSLYWADGGRTLAWSFTNRFYRVARDTVLRAQKREEWKPEEIEISLRVPRHIPQGKLYLRGARIVTMKGEEVIERGDILIENNRIRSIVPSASAPGARPPADARVIELRGKTVIPGFVDIHAHLRGRREVMTDQEWSYAANLAYGVTTTRDPSIESNVVFAQGELIEAGGLLGPRIYATGTAMTTLAVDLTSAEEAENIVRRYKRHGADSLKQYFHPRRIQRQWLAMAAAKEGVNITAEGAGDLKVDLSMVLDGYTGFEHSLPIVPLYKDVTELLARAGSTYTPTLVVSYGGPSGQFYWRQRMDIHGDAKVRRFTPHREVDNAGRRRPLVLDDDYHFSGIARGAAAVAKAGGSVGLGAHGEQQGIGAHWELWMLQAGGLAPHQVLRVATLSSAEAIGLARDVGSIEVGKLADLIVLNANPLEDIRNTNTILYVIKNGELFDGATLDQLWPVERKFLPFFWQRSDAELEKLPR